MTIFLSGLLGFVGFGISLYLSARLFDEAGYDPEVLAQDPRSTRGLIDTGPRPEPCWTEEIGRDGRNVYARAQCPSDLLMELDARAERWDYPVPIFRA